MAKFRSFVLLIAILVPSVVSADVYSWTFGGGADLVSGSGTLTANVLGPNLDMIGGGSGSISYGGATYNVDILPLIDVGHSFPSVHYGAYYNACGAPITYNLPCATLQNPPGSKGANYTFDNDLYLNSLPGNSELDALGIVLYNPSGPSTSEFFNLWSSGSSYNPLPDNLWATDTGDGWNNSNVTFSNPFTVTLLHTPDPEFYAVLAAFGLILLIGSGFRRKRA